MTALVNLAEHRCTDLSRFEHPGKMTAQGRISWRNIDMHTVQTKQPGGLRTGRAGWEGRGDGSLEQIDASDDDAA